MTLPEDSLQAELEERLRFETLLADLSGRFVNVPAEQVDGEIKGAQGRVCQCLGMDLSSLWQCVDETSRVYKLTHLYRPLGGPPLPERVDTQEYFPWSLLQLIAGNVVAVSSMGSLPPEAARDQEVWRYNGIKSALGLPLSTGGGVVIGFLTFDTMRAERTWPEALVQRLLLVTQIFANALARKRSDQALRESEERLKLATDSAGAGLWSMDLDTRRVWVSPRMREMFPFAPAEELTLESFLKVIHPEDREEVQQSVQRASETDTPLAVEFRIVLPDGSIRWISARGQMHCNPSGKPDRLLGASVAITGRKQAEEALRQSYAEIRQLKEQLQAENVSLRQDLQLAGGHAQILGRSAALQRVLALAEQVAATDSTVLLLGETGTGKELIASAIHKQSARRNRPMVRVSCAAIPQTLIESELFGREKGAYTGAAARQLGRFEAANHSTLYLDEIGELPLEVQVKLLRVLQEKQIERLGSSRSLPVDVRIISSTNRDLEKGVREGRFREDLYYRLAVFPITIPPLRERREDIPVMVHAFADHFARTMGKTVTSISQSNLDALKRYGWPGNVRELRNVVERAMILARGPRLTVEVPDDASPTNARPSTLEDVEREHILRVLERTGWRVQGKGGAAEILGLKRTTLESRMAKLGICRPSG